jgi:hypothetical protein
MIAKPQFDHKRPRFLGLSDDVSPGRNAVIYGANDCNKNVFGLGLMAGLGCNARWAGRPRQTGYP